MGFVKFSPTGMGVGLPRQTLSPNVTQPVVLVKRRPGVVGPVRRSVRHLRCVVAAIGTVDPSGVLLSAQAVPTIVASAAMCLGAVFACQNLVQDQSRFQGSEACPSCGGTGYELCFCSKWSDGDVGCSACGHTGYTKCRACGGGGTAVPIPITERSDGSA